MSALVRAMVGAIPTQLCMHTYDISIHIYDYLRTCLILIPRTFLSESEKQGIHGLTSFTPVLIKCSDNFAFRFFCWYSRLAKIGGSWTWFDCDVLHHFDRVSTDESSSPWAATLRCCRAQVMCEKTNIQLTCSTLCIFFLRMRQFLTTVWAYLLPWFLHVPLTLLDMLFQNNSCFNGNFLANPNSTTTLWLETRLRDSRTQDLLDGWWDLAKGLEPKFWGQGPRCGFHAIPAIAHGLLDAVSKLSMTMLE